MFKYFFKQRTPIRLGRWEHRLNDTQINLKNILSNHDHCGDKICQYPVNIKNKDKEKEKDKIKNKKTRRHFSSSNKKDETDSCCILLGFHGFCENCKLLNNKL